MTNEQLITEFQKLEDAFNKAIVSNSLKEIRKCVTADWVLDCEGGIFP